MAIAETRRRRRGERPSRGGSLRARCVRGGWPRRNSGSGPERAAPLEGSAGRQRDDSRRYRRHFELVDEFYKANAESGLHLAVASGAPVVADFIRDFESVFSGGSALDDAKPPVHKAAAATGSARAGPSTQTL